MENCIQFIVCLLGLAALVTGGIIVNTTHGPVQGSIISRDSIEYYAYQGIKYGQARRFEAPKPINPWNGIYNATSFKFVCYALNKIPVMNESEDCLYLNVYVPKGANLSNIPVIFYVHDGGFVNGDSWINHFGPDYLVNRTVIVVTTNYRLGVFGFVSTGDTSLPGNYGLKDLILALQWVKNNSRNFGGNPNNITIFGESAGGALVGYLVQSPKAAGLFQRAISMSGNNICPWSYISNPAKIAHQTGLLVGCTASTSQALVNCLKGVDADVLRNASSTVTILREVVLLYGLVNDQGYAPSIEPNHEDAVITNSNYQAFLSGNFNRVPWIIGFSSEEALGLGNATIFIRALLLQAVAIPAILVPQDMHATGLGALAAGNAVANYYFGSTLQIPLATDAQVIRYFSDNLFDRPTREIIRITAPYIPVWYYRFSYFGKLGQFTYQVPGVGKAQHASILYYIWRIDTLDYNNTDLSQYPAQDFKIRDDLVTLLTNFAKYGNPTSNSDPVLQNVQWPLAYASGNQTVHCYDIDTNITVVNNPEQDEYNMWKNLYDRYGDGNYITY